MHRERRRADRTSGSLPIGFHTYFVVKSIQKSRNSWHHRWPQRLHVVGQLFYVAAIKSNRTADNVHSIFATSLEHVRQRQKADHNVTGGWFVVAELQYNSANTGHNVLVRQHDTLRVSGCTGSVAHCAQVRRSWRHFRMISLRAETLDVLEPEEFDTAILRSLIRRWPRFLHHYQLPQTSATGSKNFFLKCVTRLDELITYEQKERKCLEQRNVRKKKELSTRITEVPRCVHCRRRKK